MFDKIQRIESAEGNVKKSIFTKPTAVAEAVLYKYPTYKERTVICCSTMSGCPVGCRFCGAGDFFVKTLSADEIVAQVEACFMDVYGESTLPHEIDKLQIMFMSMGEPLLNPKGLSEALKRLNKMYPNASLLISSIAPDVDYNWLYDLSVEIPQIGLQFSIHETTDEARSKLIPFKKKLSLQQIAAVGSLWAARTGRKPFFNYCAGDLNSTEEDAERLRFYFHPETWNATVSVICERNEGLPAKNDHQIGLAADFSSLLVGHGYDVRVFDPAGQDDIGGGCGQLWFVQDWMKNNPDKAKPSIGYGKPKVHTPVAA